jgi:RecA-family ATPase
VTHSGPGSGRHRRSGDTTGDNRPWNVTVSATDGSQRITAWSAADLLAAQFADPKWAVPGLFPEGLSLLAGPPKIGKSFMALGLAIAIAAGGKAFGSIDVEAGAALYLALEDTPRRLQKRLRQMLAGSPPPPELTLAIESPVMHAGGLAKIDDWLSKPRDIPPRLVIIDVLEKFRGPVPQGISAYAADYQAISAIKSVADAHGVGIILIHHVRKVSAEDFLSEISGTLGLSGAADTICALKRSRGELDATLHVTGRDVDENEYALTFTPELGLFQLVGLASEYGLSENRRKILAYLRIHEGCKPAEIAIGTSLSRDLVKQTCGRMADDSQLDTDGHGHYFVPQPGEPQL